MTQRENECLEDSEERFQLSYKRAHNCTLDEDSLILVLFRGDGKELMETLNLLSNGDSYQLDYGDIKQIFRNHSRVSKNKGRNGKESGKLLFSFLCNHNKMK